MRDGGSWNLFWHNFIGVSFAVLIVGLICFAAHHDHKATAERFFRDGYEAALIGVPVEAGPVRNEVNRDDWNRGWIAGFRELKSKGKR